ncbi:glycosyltransferase family 2 protein [Desulfosporosinus sp. BICA1-9]|uniref:glycosyltransferase family 2 protein n=1 Tax=Desulfosporosinus sp. BICA1-9 TaxID=1531958 RepID=UPI00054B57E8|nr:glycosyltransferase family 2 protein [Desulfosporosinus sp. BICA1-9]KJS47774.1 MAG: glycosyltransferase [Peptococcaceae bacterium BRH_c23]KJS81742.1 MAG: glycosyltransferase [Desulfosporosinus sp. BICA1-9]HBW35530.1 glycosyltransferase family 2 protein [Desulfosporosinus sp.]
MLYIVLPAYNEEQALPALLEDIEQTCAPIPHQIVIVNDGSTDHTSDVVRSFAQIHRNIHNVNHSQNQGLGAALNSGFQYVLNFHRFSGDLLDGQLEKNLNAPDIVITMDADNTQPADCIPLLYDAICAGADLVIASRYVSGGEQNGLSLGRRGLSWGAGRVMHYFAPIKGVRDYSCGYRAYRLALLAEGTRQYGPEIIKSRNFSGMVELLLKVAPFAECVTEIPLKLHYELKKGASKLRILPTIWGYVQLIYQLKRNKWRTVEWAEE